MSAQAGLELLLQAHHYVGVLLLLYDEVYAGEIIVVVFLLFDILYNI